MKAKIAAAVLAVIVLPAAHAAEPGQDAKRQEYFGKAKELKLQAMRERVSLMQESMSCMQSAQNPDSMKSCEQRERSAMEQHHQRMKERWEASKPR